MTMTRTFLLCSALIGFSLLAPSAIAQQKDKAPPGVPTATLEQPPALKRWIDAENALIKPLSDKDKESFFILRNKYSVMRVIKIVERDVGAAVKSCGEKNPDMKDKMTGRFDQWKSAVDPILDTAKKQLDKDINAQKIVDSGRVKEVLKLNDAAYEEGEKKVVKTPVTTKDACEDLLDSMDRTEDDMVKLLQQTLLTESVIRERAEQMDKEKAKASAKEKAYEKALEKKPE